MAVELSTTQFQACQDANGQFCSITTPFQPLANPPSCIAALYAKSKVDMASKCSLQICKASATKLPSQRAPDVWNLTTPVTASINTMTLICLEKPMETIPIQKPIHILKLPMACSATSSNVYLSPRYETLTLDGNISLNMANLHMINISAQDFCMWQHLEATGVICNYSISQLYPQFQYTRFISIFSIAPYQSYLSIQNQQGTLIPSGHPGIYVSAIGLLIPLGIDLFCCYFFWCQPARLACQPLQPGNT